jgi:anaerobic magnesium-protoporphyrin IX monomethyl ester cyclase
MTRVTLIRPPAVSSIKAYSVGVVPPIGPAYLAGSLEAAGHEVTIIDALGADPMSRYPGTHPRLALWGLRPEQIIARIPRTTRLIGVSVMFSQQWPEVDALIRAIARELPNVPIVVGGEHPTATWESLLDACPDILACALGEGEDTIVDLANWADPRRLLAKDLSMIPGLAIRQSGKPTLTASRPRIRAVDQIPRPAWHLVDLEPYFSAGLGHGVNRGRSIPMLATRGCPYQCSFCSNPNMWTTRYVLREPADVVDEIADYVARYRIDNIDFVDLTLVIRKRWVLEFCERLRDSGLRVTYQLPSGTRSEVLDDEVLTALRDSGCRNITYAPESGSRQTLAQIRKQLDPDRLLESMRVAHRLDLKIKANLMIGFPDESRRELYETLRFGLKAAWIGIDDLPLYPVCPYPGTELYEQLRERGRVPPLDNEFYSRLGYMDLGEVFCVSQHIGPAELGFYRFAGMAAFYLVGYVRHPRRVVRTIRNLLAQRSESVLEQRLVEAMKRWRPTDPRTSQ